MVYELKNLDSDDDTEARITYLSVKEEGAGRRLLSEYRCEAEKSSVKRTYFEFQELSDLEKEVLAASGFSIQKREGQNLVFTLKELSAVPILTKKSKDYVKSIKDVSEKELKNADACVACTGNDEENLIISMFAKSFGLDRIAAVIDNYNYEVMLKRSGINHIFSTQDVALIDVIKDARLLATAGDNENDNNVMKWFYTLNDGRIEAAEFEIGKEFAYLEVPFKEKRFQLKAGILIAVIMRGDEVIVPDGNSCIKEGDHVIVVSAEHKIARLSDIFAKGIKEN